mmetsp:Transcript_22908/g.54195  ORF Transcript_22908/g.54195 Transcript_22908/m.54195 type:complete len:697 (-) Transcript_22908:349-2439(-)
MMNRVNNCASRSALKTKSLSPQLNTVFSDSRSAPVRQNTRQPFTAKVQGRIVGGNALQTNGSTTLMQGAARNRKQQMVFSRSYTAPVNDMRFLLRDVWDFPSHYKKLPLSNGENVDSDFIDMVLDENAKFAENVLYPLNEGADSVGCKRIDDHTITTPPGFKEAYQQFNEGQWFGMTLPEQYGGQGLPSSLYTLLGEMNAAANWTWSMFPGLTQGAVNTLLSHGTEELKDLYLPPLVSGQWTGTMCLTEPQCGSDLGQVATKAEPNGDGTYKITGTKIFISCGDHDMVDNVLHCVLARLPGAPEGTRGISLFLVPKSKVNPDGSLVEGYNNVAVSRIEEKMGCHGSPTCEIQFEGAEGYLIGQENKGMNHMFTFINTSRLGTAIMGVALAELSWQNSLAYAKDRISMRALSGAKAPNRAADPIICHPSVRKMLLTCKAVTEGGRSMIYECAKLQDEMNEAKLAGDMAKVKAIDDRMGFLTPILKGFLTEIGTECTSIGIQVYGGHGYIQSNKQESIMRDIRIATVWEGTTQIQALDLLGRKIMLQKLKPINDHCKEIYAYCWKAALGGSGRSRWHAIQLYRKTLEWQFLTYRIAVGAAKDKEVIGMASVEYLLYSGYVSLAYHWLKMEVAAEAALKDKTKENALDEGFYQAKIETAHFYFENLLPRTAWLKQSMLAPADSVMAMPEASFSFDHSRG